MSLYPTTPIFSTTALMSSQPTFVSRAQSGKRYARKVDGHLWSLTATYNRLSREDMMPVFAFAIEQDGAFGTFTIIPPDLAVPRGTALGAPLVDGASQVGTSLVIKDCTASQAAFLKQGDVFSLAGDLKVYMMIANAATDGAGATTLNFRPPLEKSPADGAVVTVADVAFTMSFTGASRKYSAVPPLLYDYEVDLIEAI